MKQYNYNISSIDGLNKLLHGKELMSMSHSQSQLVQIYSAKTDSKWYESLGEAIRTVFPSAIIVGASSVGEINEGKIFTHSTVILFSFFDSSSLHIFSHECKPGDEEIVGKSLVNNIESISHNIKGILLLSTPIGNDSGKIFNCITTSGLNYPIFGGGAGEYSNKKNTLIYDGIQCYKQGVIAVALSGNSLNIELFTYLEWQPLSKEMTITQVSGTSVMTIDDKPAFSVYEKYLGIKANKYFFQNSLEFPFLIYRNGQIIARTPFGVNEKNGSIELKADIKAGEKFRIGYGNPQMILTESVHIQNQMRDFKPEAIFLYSCICRRFLMQQDVDLETLPFNGIAPSAGFYTFGEFYSKNAFSSLLNSTMVAVGFRESAIAQYAENEELIQHKNNNSNVDPYINQHSRILSRLLYFINVTTNELEEQNQTLKNLNEQKNEFLGVAAHDLRNPLGVIQGFSELLENKIDDKYKKYPEMISKVSSKMLHLLNELLDISKIEAGKLELKKREIDYITFVEQNIKMNEFLAQDKKVEMIRDFEMPVQPLSFDDGKIDQVLNNLISNAIKYSYPNSSITIKVMTENNHIITQVIDHGPGIPGKEINKIFHPFKKASIKPISGETGHGLGLAIVKKIIEGHNGNVGVTSTQGQGSTFYFALPLQ